MSNRYQYFGLVAIAILLQSCAILKDNNQTSNIQDQESLAAYHIFKQGDYLGAIKSYEKLINKYPNDQNLKLSLAESYRLSGHIEKAQNLYDTILMNNPDNIEAREGKGLGYLQQGRVEDALKELDQVVKKDAAKWRTLNAIAIIYSMQKQDQEAFRYYNMALSISPDNSSILNNIALLTAFGGNMDKAVVIQKSAMNIVKHNPKKLEKLEGNLALLYGISGDMNKAKEILSKYLSEDQIYNNLGYYASLADNPDLAWSYFSKAVAMRPVYYEKAENNIANINAVTDLNIVKFARNAEDRSNLKVKRGRYGRPLPILK